MNQKALILSLLLFLATGGAVAADITVPEGDGPVPVTVLVYMLDLDDVDSSQQTFTANVFLKYDWDDPRLAHEGDGPVIMGMDEIWHPHFQILNQQKLWKTFPERFTVFPDGHVNYRQRVWGDFSQPMDLRDYPADHQVMTVELVASGHTSEQVRLVPSTEAEHAIAAELSVTDFEITGSEVVVGSFKPWDSGPGVASIRSIYFASRKTGYFVVKVIIPLILIVMMSWSVFWIDPAEGGTQIGVATTTMLTLIAFRFAIDTSLPKISYLTRLDTFVMASTVLVFLSLFEVVITSRLAKTGRQERAMLLDRWSRLIFPGAFVAVTVLALS
ncbi:MAG: hypothetical protein KAJ78_08435 [Acidobacteria bacterium]|nr:hypothetical protein [Acidobacteriota bacterium]